MAGMSLSTPRHSYAQKKPKCGRYNGQLQIYRCLKGVAGARRQGSEDIRVFPGIFEETARSVSQKGKIKGQPQEPVRDQVLKISVMDSVKENADLLHHGIIKLLFRKAGKGIRTRADKLLPKWEFLIYKNGFFPGVSPVAAPTVIEHKICTKGAVPVSVSSHVRIPDKENHSQENKNRKAAPDTHRER